MRTLKLKSRREPSLTFFNKKKLNVNSFHNFGISKKNLSLNFIPLCFDKENNIEAMMHKTKKIYGIMWHPEREKKINKKDINFIKNKILKQ